jgi:hypothetical protein
MQGNRRVLARQGWAGEKGDFFNSLLERHGRPCTRWEVARSWRLGRQICYVVVSAQLKLRPARQQSIELPIGGKQNHPRRLCSSRQRRFLHDGNRLVTYWSLVPL